MTAELELRQAARLLLALRDPADKAARTRHLGATSVYADASLDLQEPDGIPGRPERPALVSPRDVPQRGVANVEARAALLHALAHIEFNAINLALDAIWRFAGMPQAYYQDWLKVASEEALHYTLLTGHLQTLGFAYGDFPAHDGLWQMAEKTRQDLVARMALVPRTLEARGLDASPAIRAKLAGAGDAVAAGILDIILRDEIGHVAIGNRWYRYLCERDGVDPVAHYAALVEGYAAPVLRGPFNMEARREAGFTEAELRSLEGTATSGRDRPRSA
ncbi:MAG: ferritin-like domain-containing protein [Pigmentiphaga sp.]|uniref:ferritin-like domain-containing protein n=1 Tax=Pigmentiphaga sp. TaxID=1977564 RepID=UPI0029BD13F3|nr:ferritin-like domain-containing protein [Pigmentiphaga sp.]MDX3905037.1 ferritin-like domain-containing protein [Pigmentiphaga sp.]